MWKGSGLGGEVCHAARVSSPLTPPPPNSQFGDFVNGAQTIIDQFLSAGETKWYRQCGLTLLLPHGMEGQGPEHSSARIERFLQAVDDQENVVPPMAEEIRMQIQQTNMQVVNCTTPANYFHVLRRQVHRSFRKPLIIATPKSLLRHKSAVSPLRDMAEGSTFQRFIPDGHSALVAPKKVRKLLICSGKVYYDLEAHRTETKSHDVAIARLEQIAPFPFDLVAAEVARFPGAQVVWVQEEPRNMAAWFYVAPRIASATRVLCGKEVQPVSGGGGGEGGCRPAPAPRSCVLTPHPLPLPPPSCTLAAPRPRPPPPAAARCTRRSSPG